ncbi:proliferating cell nuclear antigen (pcna) [Candidatus Woesearchaeota archaeon]|nr:proliferating cell nuclear antigen (pcna) [Candidatus Woesearchaeota archaeon]
MKLTLAEPKYFKDSLSIISELVNEARFKITKDSMDLVAMDPANVAMVMFKLLSSSFTEYDVKKEAELSINLSNLKLILRRVNPTDILTLELTNDNKLKVELKGTTKRTFYIPLIEIEDKEQKVPDLKFPVTVKTKSSILTDAVEDADIVAESLTLSVTGDKFTIDAEGDMNQASIELKEDDSTHVVSDSKEKIKSRYSIEYLKKMITGAKLADEVTINFSTDYPLKLEYKTVDKLMLAFILAPRVEND